MNIREFTKAIDLHDQLNPLLWEGDRLRPQVRLSLEHTAYKFEQFLGFPVDLEDIIITGSQTAYTYTEASDIDLHLIVDFQRIQCDQPVEELFDTKRRLWKEQHDIKIYGIPVECYVEDLARPVRGNSYSLVKDQWIRQPQGPEDPDLPPNVISGAAAWTRIIKTSIASRSLETCRRTQNLLRAYRQEGLALQGELGTANLVFKTLRNNGVLRDLALTLRHLEDQDLSLT
jgi:hypothetical protein